MIGRGQFRRFSGEQHAFAGRFSGKRSFIVGIKQAQHISLGESHAVEGHGITSVHGSPVFGFRSFSFASANKRQDRQKAVKYTFHNT